MKWWSVAAGALLAGGLVMHPVLLAPSSELVLGGGVLAWLGFASALAGGRWALGGAAAGLFVAQYALALVLRPAVDLLAPVVGVGLFVLVEMVDASGHRSRGRKVEPDAATRYMRDTGTVALLGTLVAAWVAVAGVQGRGGGTLRLVVGAACLLGAVIAAAVVVTRSIADERRPSGERLREQVDP